MLITEKHGLPITLQETSGRMCGVTKVIVYGNGGKEIIRYLVMIQ